MIEGYTTARPKKWFLPVLIIVLIVAASLVIFFLFINKEKMVSPIPPKPSF